jgi:curli biogenesis system outer membrane secretion channel CsgG
MKKNCIYLGTALLIMVMIVIECGCARVNTSASALPQNSAVKLDDGYTGPKKRVQVMSFDLPDTLVKRYPELGQKRIGFGLANRLVDAFYETNRFQFVEEKDAVLNKIMKNWAMSQTGAVAEASAVKTDGLLAPQFLVYAEVFDFSVGNTQEVNGLAAKERKVTRIGIQIRLVDVATSEYVPASGVGEEVERKNSTIWAASDAGFDQSTMGRASQAAINTAVLTLIKRMK